MISKICFRCKKEKPVKDYNKDKQAKDGLRASCKPCLLERARVLRNENLDRARAYGRSRNEYLQNYRKDKQKERALEARKYMAKHGDKVRAYRRKWYSDNKERLQAKRAEYIKNNPWFNRANSSKRRAALLERIPSWADIEAIKEVFRSCPKDMVVDHVIPLQGEIVSGLHLHINMQYLTPSDNSRKWNHFGGRVSA